MKRSVPLLIILALFSFIKIEAQDFIPFDVAIGQIEESFEVQIHCPERYKPESISFNLNPETLESNLDQLIQASILNYFSYDEQNIIIGPTNLIETELNSPGIISSNEIQIEEEQIERFAVGDADAGILPCQLRRQGKNARLITDNP